MTENNLNESRGIEAVSWNRKHLLDIDEFSISEFDLVMKTADAMSDVLSRPIRKVPALRGKTIATLFYEPSTRTRSSFELAAKNLSADVVNLAASSSSISKGENLIDTVHTLEAMGVDILIMRHPMAGAGHLAARYAKSSVINAGDGGHAHPTQALLDMYTILKHKTGIDGLKIVILGDSRHSRVARSNIWGLTAMGASVTICGPRSLLPIGLTRLHPVYSKINYETDILRALDGADVVMALRMQKERQSTGLIPDIREYVAQFRLTSQRLAAAKPDALVMHPGPVNEDIEISSDVASGPQSVINEQVSNGLAVRMAVLYLITGGSRE